jgi:single-stranded-DNA-specific exonuclease
MLGAQPHLVLRQPSAELSPEETIRLAAKLGVQPRTLDLVLRRGIAADLKTLQNFFSPKLADLTHPEAMAGYEPALDLIEAAIAGGWKIGVFGDYDVDGVTSAALVSLYLEGCGAEVVTRVAERDRGYGLALSIAQEFAEAGVSMLIACDCGTSDHESLTWLRQAGIRTVVIDHHQAPDVMPPTDALLNPHQPECLFPFKGMCSAGVAFYLCAGLRSRLVRAGKSAETLQDPRAWLDLVALATVCDMVPMVGNNRIMVHHGLRILSQRKRPGIDALLSRAGAVATTLDESHIGFVLGPRLNAPGRLASARPSLDLLRARTSAEATPLAQSLERYNNERKRYQATIFDAAQRLLREDPRVDERAGLVVAAKEWLPGVVGIAAASLVSRFRRPALVLGFDHVSGEARGSARTYGGIDVLAALRRCEHLVRRCGGHKAAAGVSLHWDRVPELVEAFDEAVREVTPADACAQDDYDGELSLAMINHALVADIRSAGPYGVGFPEPRYLVSDVRVIRTRPIGASHLALTLMQGSATVDAIAFDSAHLQLGEGSRVSCIGAPQIHEFAGRQSVQLRLSALWGVSETGE